MTEVLITYKMHPETVEDFDDTIAYAPEIGCPDIDEVEPPKGDESRQAQLAGYLTSLQPRALIVGNNSVFPETIDAWRAAMGSDTSLTIVRRGTETGGIDAEACAKHSISIQNTPGINSPYVARHMLSELPKSYGRLAIIGVGAIGKDIAHGAQPDAEITLYSPSLADPDRRQTALGRIGLAESPQLTVAASLDEALAGADAVAISVPWRVNGIYNKGICADESIRKLPKDATLVSCSNPGIFTPKALALMNQACDGRNMRVHIDTGTEYALATSAKFPKLEVRHDEAFADPDCQRALDQASLNKALSYAIPPK